jgi:cytidylate kinase
MEQRIQRVMMRQELLRNLAIKVINQVDERRENYVQKFCGTSRYDTRNYDLVISMENIREEDAVDIIMDYVYRQSK